MTLSNLILIEMTTQMLLWFVSHKPEVSVFAVTIPLFPAVRQIWWFTASV